MLLPPEPWLSAKAVLGLPWLVAIWLLGLSSGAGCPASPQGWRGRAQLWDDITVLAGECPHSKQGAAAGFQAQSPAPLPLQYKTEVAACLCKQQSLGS